MLLFGFLILMNNFRMYYHFKMKLPVEDRFNIDKLYNPMTIKELIEKVPQIPWLTYMNTMLAPHHVVTEDERVIVEVPDYFPKLVDLIAKTPKRFDWKLR